MAMTYAQALSEAKGRILDQSRAIEAHTETIQKQRQEIAQRRAHAAGLKKDLSDEIEKNKTLELELTRVAGAKEAAEATVGRQRVQLDQIEARSAEQQETIDQQIQRLADLEAEIESLREELEATRTRLPTDEDIAALNEMRDLLGDEQPADAASEAPAPAPVMSMAVDVVDAQDDPNADTATPSAGQQNEDASPRSVFCFTRAAA